MKNFYKTKPNLLSVAALTCMIFYGVSLTSYAAEAPDDKESGKRLISLLSKEISVQQEDLAPKKKKDSSEEMEIEFKIQNFYEISERASQGCQKCQAWIVEKIISDQLPWFLAKNINENDWSEIEERIRDEDELGCWSKGLKMENWSDVDKLIKDNHKYLLAYLIMGVDLESSFIDKFIEDNLTALDPITQCCITKMFHSMFRSGENEARKWNQEDVLKWNEKIKNTEHPLIQYLLFAYYQDDNEGLTYLKKAAKLGSLKAINYIACHKSDDYELIKEFKDLSNFETAANQDEMWVHYALAEWYLEGNVCTKNLKKSFNHYYRYYRILGPFEIVENEHVELLDFKLVDLVPFTYKEEKEIRKNFKAAINFLKSDFVIQLFALGEQSNKSEKVFEDSEEPLRYLHKTFESINKILVQIHEFEDILKNKKKPGFMIPCTINKELLYSVYNQARTKEDEYFIAAFGENNRICLGRKNTLDLYKFVDLRENIRCLDTSSLVSTYKFIRDRAGAELRYEGMRITKNEELYKQAKTLFEKSETELKILETTLEEMKKIIPLFEKIIHCNSPQYIETFKKAFPEFLK